MTNRNTVEIDTPFGRRSIELLEGDITALPEHIDVLAISAFAGSYAPTHGTVIRALFQNCAIDVDRLSQETTLDFRQSLGIWISPSLNTSKFSRLLCVDIIGTGLPYDELFESMFVGLSILEAKGIPVEHIAMPLLGAGRQKIQPDEIVAALLTHAKNALLRLPRLEKVVLVEIDPNRAQQLDKAMDTILERSRSVVTRSAFTEDLRKDVLNYGLHAHYTTSRK